MGTVTQPESFKALMNKRTLRDQKFYCLFKGDIGGSNMLPRIDTTLPKSHQNGMAGFITLLIILETRSAYGPIFLSTWILTILNFSQEAHTWVIFDAVAPVETEKIRGWTQRELLWGWRWIHLSLKGTLPPSWPKRLDKIRTLATKEVLIALCSGSSNCGFICLLSSIKMFVLNGSTVSSASLCELAPLLFLFVEFYELWHILNDHVFPYCIF